MPSLNIECFLFRAVSVGCNVCYKCLCVSIHGDRVFTHSGERTKEGIVEFAKRAYG